MDIAYIAGFFDGDGSLMLQLKRRSDTRRGWRFMATICFYQDSKKDDALYWMRDVFGIGFISKRSDGITEFRINGFETVGKVLKMLLPHLRFKQRQANLMMDAIKILSARHANDLKQKDLYFLSDCILAIQSENYKSGNRRSREKLFLILGLTP